MKYYVRDKVRTREVDGVKLSESTSRVAKAPRWVEFSLYRTKSGQYVLARVGHSLVYHDQSCFSVSRNKLSEVDGLELPGDFVPCYECKPDRADVDGVFPEKPRYAMWVCVKPEAVIKCLLMEDDDGTEYLTNVAERLLVDAAKIDPLISEAFYNDSIE